VKKPFPIVSIIPAVTTLVASAAVSTAIEGSPWRRAPILALRDYGGVNNAQLANGKSWRLVTSQFRHVSGAHAVQCDFVCFFLVSQLSEQQVRFDWLYCGC
jgi:hypothetical protein